MKSKWFPFRKLHDQALDAEQRPDLSLIQRDRLSDNGAGGGRLVLPGRRQDTDGLVVAGKTVDTRLNENETELGVLVLAVALKVLADGNSLLSVMLVFLLPDRPGIWRRGLLTFLINMYRSSGSSGARPVRSLCQP